jgi:hypothetical protein
VHVARPVRVSFTLALSLSIGSLVAAGASHAQPRLAPGVAHLPPGGIVARLPPPGATAFSSPQSVTPPFGLQILNSTFITQTPAFTAFSPKGLVEVQNPAVVFEFPITPDQNAYIATPGGLHFAYKAIGWLGTVGVEACLTRQELTAWPGATAVPARPDDATTCPAEQDVVHSQFVSRAWYQVTSVKVDEYVVQNGGFTISPTPIPLNIQQIDMPMRFHTNGYTLYYTNAHPGPNSYADACPKPQFCTDSQIVDLHTNPFTLVVMPTALIQLKVLPQTIVYLPPGDASLADNKVTATFTTTLTAGQTTQVDNSVGHDQWMEDVDQTSDTVSIAKVFSEGYSSSTDTRWDTKTTVKTGQALERDLQGVNQTQTIIDRQVKGNAVNVPGPAGTFANAPFWSDEVVVLVHPQFAMWDFYGKTTVQLIAASSTGTLPDTIAETVGELDACARGVGSNSAGIAFTPADSVGTDILTPTDCKALAALDPFYNKGQSANVSNRGTLFAAPQPYGTPTSGPPEANSITLSKIDSTQTSVTTQSTQTYAATAEDIVATTTSQGLSLGLNTSALNSALSLGLTSQVTLKQGSSSDTSQTMTLTYKNSSVTTNRVDVAVTGTIADCPPTGNGVCVARAYAPQVTVYLDNVFGGLMFVDPGAPCEPQPACRIALPVGPQPVSNAP